MVAGLVEQPHTLARHASPPALSLLGLLSCAAFLRTIVPVKFLLTELCLDVNAKDVDRKAPLG